MRRKTRELSPPITAPHRKIARSPPGLEFFHPSPKFGLVWIDIFTIDIPCETKLQRSFSRLEVSSAARNSLSNTGNGVDVIPVTKERSKGERASRERGEFSCHGNER